MKKLTQIFSLLMLSFLTITATQAQDASLDDILKNYFENIGGEEEWKKIKSMSMEGTSAMGGMSFPVSIKSMEPTYMKLEIDIQGKKIIQAFDGENAWGLNPLAGVSEPQKGDEEQSKEMKKQKFQDEFIDYKEKGHKLELAGMEEVDGAQTYKIKMVKKSGDVVFYFFDTENFVPIMIRAFVDSGPMKGQSAETFMSDYQEVAGLMIPFTTEQKVGGQTMFSFTAEKVALNDENLEAEMFAFPGGAEKEEEEEKN